MNDQLLNPTDFVLVVDDEQFSRQIVARFLRELGNPEVHMARNGEEALAALIKSGVTYRLVISDLNMPVKNGLQFLKVVRTSTMFIRHDLPVIMLTGLADRALVGAALALDVDSFLVKPVSRTALASRIARALDTRTLKAPEAYNEVDVAAACAGLLGHDPIGTVRKEERKPDSSRQIAGRRVVLDEVQPGAVLANEIRLPGGELLLASGVTLSARMIRRLKDLVDLNVGIDAVWVTA